MKRPSGLYATPRTVFLWPKSSRTGIPDVASQTLTVRSSPAEAMKRPSGLYATLRTAAEWPMKVSICRPLATSQTLTVRSAPAEAMKRPSGLYATPERAGMPPERKQGIGDLRQTMQVVPLKQRHVCLLGGRSLLVEQFPHDGELTAVPRGLGGADCRYVGVVPDLVSAPSVVSRSIFPRVPTAK